MTTWNAALYDTKHSYVSKYGEDVLELLSPRAGEKILDVGCGTGDLSFYLQQAGAIITGIDASAAMIENAREKYPGLIFLQLDATAMPFAGQFDAVFSNAALHWIHPPALVLQRIWQALKPAGRFIAEFGGHGNIQSIITAVEMAAGRLGFPKHIRNPWYFPTIGQYTSLLETTGFQTTYAAHFDRHTPLEGKNGINNWLSMFGSSLLSDIPAEYHAEVFRLAQKQLQSVLLRDFIYYADYKRIRIAAIKPAHS